MRMRTVLVFLFGILLIGGTIFIVQRNVISPADTNKGWSTQLPPIAESERKKLPQEFPKYLIQGNNAVIVSYEATPQGDNPLAQEKVIFTTTDTIPDLIARYQNFFENAAGWELLIFTDKNDQISAVRGATRTSLHFVQKNNTVEVTLFTFLHSTP